MEIYSRSKKWLKDLNVLGDASQLPAKLVDALEVIAIEEGRTDDEIELAVARVKRGYHGSNNGDRP